MKHAKRIGALICVIAICFTLVLAPSVHALGNPLLGGQQFGAWIASGLMALNIIGQSLMPAPGPVDPYLSWLNSPASQTQTDYQYPVANSLISNYLNASTIKVSQGVKTIDGVEYDELWVSPGTFTNGLKTNLFDFKTKWNILSGQAGITLAEGWGTYNGAYLYNVSGTIKSPTYGPIDRGGSVSVGNGSISVGSIPDTWEYFRYDYGNGQPINVGNRQVPPYTGWIYVSGNSPIVRYRSTYGYEQQMGLDASLLDNTPFEFEYTSGIVPADESEIPENYGLSIQIPHDKLQTFYNTYPEYNVNNTTIYIAEDQVDIDELTQAIFDMIDSMDDFISEWTDGEQPEPPAPVDPVENIDQNVQDITQYQADMQQQVDHMHQDVEGINQTQQQMQQTQQQMQQDTSSIDSTLTNATATPGESDLPSFKFDLRELFPFCIPFDIYRLLSSFDATPQAPHVRLPIVIQSIGFSYTLDLDFSAWNPVAQAMRTAELVVYAIGLAWATGKVIKW